MLTRSSHVVTTLKNFDDDAKKIKITREEIEIKQGRIYYHVSLLKRLR